ncbi:MAG: phage tail protein [Rickettsiales bacterium]
MKLIDIDSLNPSTYNPRTADPRRLDLIELSLRKLGFLLPIYATPDGEIISGHQRHHVAKRLGVRQVPVEFTRAMDLEERKGVNVAFNRATNDLRPKDTPENITDALKRVDVLAIAEIIPDKMPDTPEFYPCMKAQTLPIAPLLKANKGRWITYAASISKTLYLKGVLMPIVTTKDLRVVNGIGRLQMQAESKRKEVAVVLVTEEEAKLADAMLNLLSMDFDIHNRYRDLLRYNSFRRLRRVREDLGRGFIFMVAGNSTSKDFDVAEPKNRDKWIKEHGKSVLDFGAGHLHETEILRSIGVRVTPFEPYRVNEVEEIDKAESLRVVDEFLADIGDRKIHYNSVFISSVLNSVPFAEDNLDPLWADDNIDVVAIDCYFPLTPDLPQSQIDYQKVYDGWSKDEGWDYYWDTNRTTKTFYSGATYAWKNVKNWWNSTHTNPNATTTAWTAKMKPLWFSELGFPSVDGCSNQPNVFIDPDSVESFYPRGSRGRVDFLAQRTALEASIDYLAAQNAIEANFVPRKFVWTWDARPFPFFPDLGSVWADGSNWKTGHWVQGKLGLSSLGQIVADLLKKVGYDSTMYDTSRLTDIVSGFVITNRQSVRSCLEQLATAYFFDCVESDGLLKFIKRGKVSSTTIDFSELVVQDSSSDALTSTRTQELELPRQVDVIYLNRIADYQAGTQSSQRQTVKAVDYATVNLPIVLSDQEAKVVADVTLYNAWVGRVNYQFTVPPKYALLEPTDVITVTKDGAAYLMRVNSTKLVRNGVQEISAVAEDVSSYDFYNPAGTGTPNLQVPSSISATRLELLDLPAFPTDAVTDAYLRYGVVGLGEGWAGSAVYRSDDGGANYALMQMLTAQATIGAVLNIIPAGTIYGWDRSTTIDVLLTFGQLQSVTDIAVLNGANVCVIGEEIIQFQTATLLDTNKYRLSGLLRGRLGTDWAVASHAAGERFVLLTNAVAREMMASSGWGIGKKFKPVTIGSTLGATTAQDFTYFAKALKPYAPVHIVGSRSVGGDLTINWKRRTRIGGDWRDGVDVPLSEESERYEVEIMQGATLKRTITGLTSPTTIYTAAQQVTDFGSAQSSVSVRVYQLSAAVGRGYAGIASI